MQTGITAAVAAMEQAVRRLDAALAQRAGSFRRLAEQHGLLAAEVKTLRDDLQAAQEEAASLRERAALVDALRAELGQIQQDAVEQAGSPPAPDLLAARDSEIAALKAERDALQARLAAIPEALPPRGNGLQAGAASGEVAALKAELAAARASQTEMQAFQSGLAARLEATMARLRQVLDSQVQA